MILPMLWLRLVVVIGFTIFVTIQQMWLITAIGVVLTLLTGKSTTPIRHDDVSQNSVSFFPNGSATCMGSEWVVSDHTSTWAWGSSSPARR